MADDLWTIAQQRLARYDVSTSARALLEQEVRGAQGLVDMAPERWGEARDNVLLLIDTMGEISTDRAQVQIKEDTYFVARSKLCPLFPIC